MKKIELNEKASLTNTDNVAGLDCYGNKFLIIAVTFNHFVAVTASGNTAIMNLNYDGDIKHDTVERAVSKTSAKAIYTFTDRKELYQWLAE